MKTDAETRAETKQMLIETIEEWMAFLKYDVAAWEALREIEEAEEGHRHLGTVYEEIGSALESGYLTMEEVAPYIKEADELRARLPAKGRPARMTRAQWEEVLRKDNKHQG